MRPPLRCPGKHRGRRGWTWALAAALLAAGCQHEGDAFVGSTWRLSFETPQYRADYDITFEANGVLRSNNRQDTTPDNDRWERDGERVRIVFNDGYATFEGRLQTPGQMAGTASSPSAGTWDWRAVRRVR